MVMNTMAESLENHHEKKNVVGREIQMKAMLLLQGFFHLSGDEDKNRHT